jgi:hypothetical protein
MGLGMGLELELELDLEVCSNAEFWGFLPGTRVLSYLVSY